MFTGIVHSSLPLKECRELSGIVSLEFEFSRELLDGLETGASVAVDGVCLTVSAINGSTVSFDVIATTKNITTLGNPRPGHVFNIERSMKKGDEIGGHLLSGHVDSMAEVRLTERSGDNFQLRLGVEKRWIKYIFPKGFIAVNGVSLTVTEVDKEKSEFDIWLIPETLRRTNLGTLEKGDAVNIEIHRETQVLVDTVQETVREYLKDYQP